MPRANATRSLDEMTVGDLRRLVHAGADENLTLSDALTTFHESDQASAAHELDLRAFEAYRARRDARHAAALAEAARAADKANRSHGDGARMAARQAARLEADETFAQREPLLAFQAWIEAGRPDVHQVSAIRRVVKAVTSELVN
jgi:hypothetical protein